MIKTFASLLLLMFALPQAGNDVKPNPHAKFKGMDMTITTRDDDKKPTSRLEIFIVKADGAQPSAYLDIRGQGFYKGTTVTEHLDPIKARPFTFAELPNEKLLMKLTPDGSDTWTFRFTAVLHFDDGTNATISQEDCVLDENNRKQRLFPLSGLPISR
jgi:hypothetical protein